LWHRLNQALGKAYFREVVAEFDMGFDIYWTVKYCGIKDKRLALAYWGAVLGMLLYALTSGLVSQHSRIELEDEFEGLVRPRLKAPKKNSHKSTLDYCNKGCRRLDQETISSVIGSDSIFVTTRVQLINQTATSCQDQSQICEIKWEKAERTTFFVAGVEDYILSIDAYLEALTFHRQDPSVPYQYATDHRNMAGCLLLIERDARAKLSSGNGDFMEAGDGHVLYKSLVGEKDSILLGDLLKAAGVSDLDAPSDSSSTKGGAASMRAEGFVLKVDLFYTNLDSLTLWAWMAGKRSTMRYEISARHVPRTEFKQSEVLGESDLLKMSRGEPLLKRTVLKRHGILIRFVQHGEVGRPSLGVLMAHVAVLMASVSLVTTILDICWQIFFPLLFAVDYNDDVFQMVEDEWKPSATSSNEKMSTGKIVKPKSS